MAEKKTTKKAVKKATTKKETKKTTKKDSTKTESNKSVSDKSSSKKSDNNLLKLQPEINIGLIGHVDHGKTTLTERLSGKWTDTHSEEIKRGITIRLGYADTVFRKDESLEEPDCYTVKEKHPVTGNQTIPVRKVSFVDAPGHESLMATMLAGATIMDGALLLISASESCPQPQTREHLMALEIAGTKNLIVVQNKIDLVDEEKAIRNYNQIKEFLKGTSFENAPIVPISAQYGVNIDVLIDTIQKHILTPERDETKDPIMFVARSFDINKPGCKVEKYLGGVLGGSIMQGKLKVGDELEIKPGRVVEEQNQKVAKTIKTKIIGAMTGGEQVTEVGPGGSIALLTSLDPSVVKSDNLTGNIVGKPGTLPQVWYELKLKAYLLERLVGTTEKDIKIDPLRQSEPLMLNVNSAATVGVIVHLAKGIATCKLKLPVCADVGSKVTISRLVGNRFRLIGYGTIEE